MSKTVNCGISGMGFYMPEKKILVKELAEKSGIPEFVAEALGAETVREAADNEFPSDMAVKAARKAVEDSMMNPLELDVIIYCGAGVPDHIIPDTAGKIQHEVGAKNALAFDISQGWPAFFRSDCFSLKVKSIPTAAAITFFPEPIIKQSSIS